MDKAMIKFALLFTALLLLSGCAAQVANHEEAVKSVRDEKVPSGWTADGSNGIVDDNWLKNFKDPTLVLLVDEALKNNPGLKISEAQVDRANAMALQAGSAMKPAVGLSGAYSDRNTAGFSEVYGANFQVSWEADVWGRIRTGVTGAEEAAAASQADYEFARQSLAAATSKAWFLAIESKMLHQFAAEVVGLLEETLKIVEVKEQVGQVSMKDVHLAKANLAATREAERKTLVARQNAQRGLELLLGRYPSAEIETADQLVSVPPQIPTGLPSELMERRPDLIAAERRVAAAFYKQESAELLHLPRFSFSAGAGINNLTDAVGNLSAGLFAPLYTGGAIEAEVEIATADQKKAIAAYAAQALTAFKEVETALAGEQTLLDRQSYLTLVVDENYKAYELTRKQYEIGMIDLLDVLVVQGNWIKARIAQLDIAQQRLTNRVNLHMALGGSFELPNGGD